MFVISHLLFGEKREISVGLLAAVDEPLGPPAGRVLEAHGRDHVDEHPLGEELADLLRVGRRSHGTDRVIATRQLSGQLRRELAGDGIAELMVVPMNSGEREIGVLVLGWSDDGQAERADHALLTAQVAMAASTLRRAASSSSRHRTSSCQCSGGTSAAAGSAGPGSSAVIAARPSAPGPFAAAAGCRTAPA